jgi:uncharacterized protein (DUF427 family)
MALSSFVAPDCSKPRRSFGRSRVTQFLCCDAKLFFLLPPDFCADSAPGASKYQGKFVGTGILMKCNPSAPKARKVAKASWGGKVIAESSATVVVEGNQYFPPENVKKEFLKPSDHTTVCPWKGTAHYYHVDVNGIRNDNAAWYYPEPKPAAAEIKDRIAFWKGVRVEI